MSDRLSIALITERFGRKFGGAEAYAVDLFERLSHKHAVTVIAREFDHTLSVNEIRIKTLKGWPNWIKALHFSFSIRQHSLSAYDIVHTHAMGPVGDVHVFHVVPVKYRRFFMQPKWRGFLSCLQPRNMAYLWLEAASAKKLPARKLVAVSPSVQAQLLAGYPDLDCIEMIPPGANRQPIDAQVRALTRLALQWGSADMGCLLVARNPLKKGFAAALQALALLPGHYKLAVLGADQESHKYLLSTHPELSARVTLLEPTSKVSPYYQAADLCLHPTLMDSFAMAPLEAMAHGLPVVLSARQYCGFAAFVKHQWDAWVLENPRDPQEIAQAIFTLGEHPDLRETMVRQSESLVRSFSWESIADRYETLYDELLSERKTFQSQPRNQ